MQTLAKFVLPLYIHFIGYNDFKGSFMYEGVAYKFTLVNLRVVNSSLFLIALAIINLIISFEGGCMV